VLELNFWAREGVNNPEGVACYSPALQRWV